MTKGAAFFKQAASDFAVFEWMLSQDRTVIPECHVGHYLQMALEKLAKAILIDAQADPGNSHAAFSRLRHHLRRADIAHALGYADFRQFRALLERSAALFVEIEQLHPGIPADFDGPNVEYPWEAPQTVGTDLWLSPVGYRFPIIGKLQRTGDGAALIELIRRIFARYPSTFT